MAEETFGTEVNKRKGKTSTWDWMKGEAVEAIEKYMPGAVPVSQMRKRIEGKKPKMKGIIGDVD